MCLLGLLGICVCWGFVLVGFVLVGFVFGWIVFGVGFVYCEFVWGGVVCWLWMCFAGLGWFLCFGCLGLFECFCGLVGWVGLGWVLRVGFD